MVVLDTSGSMNEIVGTGKTRITAARGAVNALIDNLDVGRQFGMIVYPDIKDQQSECATGRVAIEFGNLDAKAAHAAVDTVVADGDTPTGSALKKAAQTLRDKGKEGVIVLVSDGESTCANEPPCDVARELTADKTGIQVNTVGFEISPTGAGELSCIANATGGQFIPASDPDQLSKAMAELSLLSAPTVSASWLELFHGDGGYYALSLWIAAGAALAFTRRQNTGSTRHSGFEWLDGCRHALTLVAVWNYGYAVIGVLTVVLGFNARSVGECVAVSFMLVTCGLAASFGASALRIDSGFAEEGPGSEALPSRELAVSACIGLGFLSIGRLVVEARPENNPPPSVLDCVMVALPIVVAVLLLAAKPINDLYNLPRDKERHKQADQEQFGPFTSPSLASTAAASATNPLGDVSSFGSHGRSERRNEPSRNDADASAVANPRTSPGDLYRIAQARTDLRSRIAAHPNAYDGLRDWIRQQQ
nr:VWA domain-containing protein [Antrihabitans stalactiti]